MLYSISEQAYKCMAALSVDIYGAFDNLWSLATIISAQESDLSAKLVQIIRNYLDQQETIFEATNERVTKDLMRDCIEGSILGSTLWNFAVDDFFHREIELCIATAEI